MTISPFRRSSESVTLENGTAAVDEALDDWVDCGYGEFARGNQVVALIDLIRLLGEGPLDADVQIGLSLGVEPGALIVGPTTEGGVSPCLLCAQLRFSRHSMLGALRNRTSEHRVFGSGFLRDFALKLIREQLEPSTEVEKRPHLARLDLGHLSVTSARIVVHPQCPRCSRRMSPFPIGFPQSDVPRPDAGGLRERDPRSQLNSIQELYCGDGYGLIMGLEHHVSGLVPTVSCRAKGSPRHSEPGYGRAVDSQTAEMGAILEALERSAGGTPRAPIQIRTATYKEVADLAVDPSSLGLYPDSTYAMRGSSVREFDSDLLLDWVWGFSFRRQEPVLVPIDSVFYLRNKYGSSDGMPLWHETSSGCAVGASPEEAILHAVLEVCERDAFLLTWLTRRTPEQVPTDGLKSERAYFLVNRIKRTTGYDVHLFDITPEQGIPCVWALAVNNHGLETSPLSASTAASHLDLRSSATSALCELAALLPQVTTLYEERRERSYELSKDPSMVRDMADHALLYGHQSSLARLGFLFEQPSNRGRQVATLAPASDIRLSLATVIDRYLRSGLDVVAVNQTSVELAQGGLSCFKALIPGTIPMSFGYHYQRTAGLDRLNKFLTVSRYRRLNPDPHPFA